MKEFEPGDANAVHHAAEEARHQADERKETMPTSPNVLLRHAAELDRNHELPTPVVMTGLKTSAISEQ